MAEPGTQEAQCSICMSEEMHDEARIVACGHKFCHGCVTQWASSRQRPLCPLCNAPLEALLRADGSREDVKPAQGPSCGDDPPDLDCLDHRYFLGEVNRVIVRAQALETTVVRDAYSCGRRGSNSSAVLLSALSGVIQRLVEYKSVMQSEQRFDAHGVLHDLYMLSDTVSDLQAGHRRGVLPEGFAQRRHSGHSMAQQHRRRGGASVSSASLHHDWPAVSVRSSSMPTPSGMAAAAAVVAGSAGRGGHWGRGGAGATAEAATAGALPSHSSLGAAGPALSGGDSPQHEPPSHARSEAGDYTRQPDELGFYWEDETGLGLGHDHDDHDDHDYDHDYDYDDGDDDDHGHRGYGAYGGGGGSKGPGVAKTPGRRPVSRAQKSAGRSTRSGR